jgi:hypothetical protein
MKTIKFAASFTIPDEMEGNLPLLKKAIWAQTSAKTDEELLDDYKKTLEVTRSAHNLPKTNKMNFLCEDGTDFKIAETGHTPNSHFKSAMITVLWNAFVDAVQQDQKLATVLPDYIKVHSSGGVCPFQAVGTVCDHPFYFRARHGDWTIDFAEIGKDPIEESFFGYTDDDPADGYMKEEDFLKIILEYGEKFKEYVETGGEDDESLDISKNPP